MNEEQIIKEQNESWGMLPDELKVRFHAIYHFCYFQLRRTLPAETIEASEFIVDFLDYYFGNQNLMNFNEPSLTNKEKEKTIQQ